LSVGNVQWLGDDLDDRDRAAQRVADNLQHGVAFGADGDRDPSELLATAMRSTTRP